MNDTEAGNRPAALRHLCERLGLSPDLAYDPKWSAAPDFLELIVEHALAEKPRTLVECSSGATTVMLARCCQLNGLGQLYSLENGPEFAARTRAELARHGLTMQATVIDAPLTRQRIGKHEFQWYDIAGLALPLIDMLVIDGPPGFIQPHSRYPALPRLADRLASGAAIFLDDAARPDEQAIAADWCRAYPGLAHRHLDNERGCAIFRWPS